MRIQVKAEPASRFLSQVAREQLPYATAVALTRTAQDGQRVVLQGLPSKFHLRRAWWQPENRMGFKIRPATKTRLTASVYTRARWMTLHEEGGTKTPRGRKLAVPSRHVFPIERLIPRRKRPRAIYAHSRPAFTIQTRAGPAVAWRRTARAPVQIFYRLIRQARIRPTLGLRGDVSRTVEQRWRNNFTRSFEDAMRTAR